MTNSYKASVALGQLRPSEDKPRRDFGDIDALADRIRATGGQPVNPICVVRDGDVYRSVDGERRYRAMREVCGDDERASVDVLVFADYSEAHAAVAMLATDDKRPLSEAERARGFQTMLRLDVDEQTVARSLNRSVADVRKARRMAAMAPEQATLDQMVRASEFEDEEDQRAVMAAANWRNVAESIQRRVDREAELAPLLAELAALGVAVTDERPEGYGPGDWCSTVEQVDDYVDGLGEGERSALVARTSDWSSGVYLHLPTAEREETDEEREARELRERRLGAIRSLRRALVRFVCGDCDLAHLPVEGGALREVHDPYGYRQLPERLSAYDVDGASALAVADSPMSVLSVTCTFTSFAWANSTTSGISSSAKLSARARMPNVSHAR